MPILIAAKRVVRVDLEDRQVHDRIVLEHARRVGAFRRTTATIDSLNFVDDMMVGQDIAAAIDENAAPHAADPRPLVFLRRERPATVRAAFFSLEMLTTQR